MFSSLCLLLAAQISAVAHDDYLNLQTHLRAFVSTDSDRRIPLIVRASFHDLMNYDPSTGIGGPFGCLARTPVSADPANGGLSGIIASLNSSVTAQFPKIHFPFGDVISLAGKVAIEVALGGCVQVPWRFGRPECTAPEAVADGPPGHMSTRAELSKYLKRYDFTENEWGILTAGAHGLRGAQALSENSGFVGVFSFVNSGRAWIRDSFNLNWVVGDNVPAGLEYVDNDSRAWRLESDIMLFPSIVAKIKPEKKDGNFTETEQFLRTFLNKTESDFNLEFAKVYAKMLNIGINPASLSELVEEPVCASPTNTRPRPTTTARPKPSAVTIVVVPTDSSRNSRSAVPASSPPVPSPTPAPGSSGSEAQSIIAFLLSQLFFLAF